MGVGIFPLFATYPTKGASKQTMRKAHHFHNTFSSSFPVGGGSRRPIVVDWSRNQTV